MGVAAAIVAGGAIQAYGNYTANQAEAKAQKANAAFYREQAKLALEAAKREQLIFDMESDQFFGSQVNAFAKGGVDLSGSALLMLAGTKQQMANESVQIIETGKRTSNLTLLRADQADKEAKRLTSFENQFISVAGPALGTASALSARTPTSSTKPTVAQAGPAAGRS